MVHNCCWSYAPSCQEIAEFKPRPMHLFLNFCMHLYHLENQYQQLGKMLPTITTYKGFCLFSLIFSCRGSRIESLQHISQNSSISMNEMMSGTPASSALLKAFIERADKAVSDLFQLAYQIFRSQFYSLGFCRNVKLISSKSR